MLDGAGVRTRLARLPHKDLSVQQLDQTDSLETRRHAFTGNWGQSWLWCRFSETSGLQDYRGRERFAVWFHAHRKLLASDQQYARDSNRFGMQVVGTLVFALLMMLTNWSANGPWLSGIMALFAGMALIWFVLREEQMRRNRMIGNWLTRN